MTSDSTISCIEVELPQVELLQLNGIHVPIKQELINRLHYANRLGILHHVAVKLYFRAIEGDFSIYTTIWSCDSDRVYLKGNISIPIRNILWVDLY